MKKIFLAFAAVAGLLALNSCNHDEENNKLMSEDAAKVVAEVDNRYAVLQAEADSICNDMVNAAAQAQYDSILAASSKGGKKAAPKPKPAPKPVDPKSDKMKGNTSNTEDKKDKMEGKSTEQIIEGKKKKMGGGK